MSLLLRGDSHNAAAPLADFCTAAYKRRCVIIFEKGGAMFKRWRRLDGPVLSLTEDDDGIAARSVIIDSGDKAFGMTADWQLDPNWRSRSLLLQVVDAAATTRQLQIVRTGPASWEVDGKARADLDGCAEIDVSATPFCNGLALRYLGEKPGELTALFVLAPELTVQPSRQRYEKLENGWRYVDLGAAKGFTAILTFDDYLIVRDYEELFETLGSGPINSDSIG